jgi:hypothetical protein
VRDGRRIAWILVAVGLLVVAAVVFFGGRHSRRRARARSTRITTCSFLIGRMGSAPGGAATPRWVRWSMSGREHIGS